MWDEPRIIFFWVFGGKGKALEIHLQTSSSPCGLPGTKQTLPEILAHSGITDQLEYLIGGQGVGWWRGRGKWSFLLTRPPIFAIFCHRIEGHAGLPSPSLVSYLLLESRKFLCTTAFRTLSAGWTTPYSPASFAESGLPYVDFPSGSYSFIHLPCATEVGKGLTFS